MTTEALAANVAELEASGDHRLDRTGDRPRPRLGRPPHRALGRASMSPVADTYAGLADPALDFAAVRESLSAGGDPVAIVAESLRRAKAAADEGIFTALVPEALVLERARQAAARAAAGEDTPLLGLTFAVKDNLSVISLAKASGPSRMPEPNDDAGARQKLACRSEQAASQRTGKLRKPTKRIHQRHVSDRPAEPARSIRLARTMAVVRARTATFNRLTENRTRCRAAAPRRSASSWKKMQMGASCPWNRPTPPARAP